MSDPAESGVGLGDMGKRGYGYFSDAALGQQSTAWWGSFSASLSTLNADL